MSCRPYGSRRRWRWTIGHFPSPRCMPGTSHRDSSRLTSSIRSCTCMWSCSQLCHLFAWTAECSPVWEARSPCSSLTSLQIRYQSSEHCFGLLKSAAFCSAEASPLQHTYAGVSDRWPLAVSGAVRVARAVRDGAATAATLVADIARKGPALFSAVIVIDVNSMH